MPESPERGAKQAVTEQSFPLLSLSDLSRLDQKLFLKPGSSGDQHLQPNAGNSAAPENKFKPGDLRGSIYVSPFQPPANGDLNKPQQDNQPVPFIPAPFIPAPFKPPVIGDQNKPQAGNQPAPFIPSPFPLPISDNRPRPAEPAPPIVPIIIPPIGDNRNKASDTPTTITPGPDGKIEITEKDFDKIGPKAKQVLLDAGVTKLTITPGQGFDTYEAELKKPLEIAQDPSIDGTRKLKIDTHFKADVKKGNDGTMMLDNIQGLTAESKILLKFRDAQVEKIQLRPTADGKSEITSTGSWNGISGTKVRIQPGEVFEKANILFDRMQKMKGTNSYMEIPPLPGR